MGLRVDASLLQGIQGLVAAVRSRESRIVYREQWGENVAVVVELAATQPVRVREHRAVDTLEFAAVCVLLATVVHQVDRLWGLEILVAV